MTRLVYTPQSKKDLNDIGLYIAQDNPRRAVSFVRELCGQWRKITEAPQAYRPRPELGEGIRSCAYGPDGHPNSLTDCHPKLPQLS